MVWHGKDVEVDKMNWFTHVSMELERHGWRWELRRKILHKKSPIMKQAQSL
jgi:hypothetical protein